MGSGMRTVTVDRVAAAGLGRAALWLALLEEDEEACEAARRRLEGEGYRTVCGRVGSMDLQKVVAAIETASRRSGLIRTDVYREEHALYHAILEALHGVCRGQLLLGGILRTVALSFAVVRGARARAGAPDEGEWIAVALYGFIGAPNKGWEHEVSGLGVMHL
jgi:hut operon positive regulator